MSAGHSLQSRNGDSELSPLLEFSKFQRDPDEGTPLTHS